MLRRQAAAARGQCSAGLACRAAAAPHALPPKWRLPLPTCRRPRPPARAQLGPGKPAHVVSAPELAAADIVLTTYDALRQDVYCPTSTAQVEEERTFRRRKKYQASAHRRLPPSITPSICFLGGHHTVYLAPWRLWRLPAPRRLPAQQGRHWAVLWSHAAGLSCALRRLQVMPTPLTRLRFWRVCLDEAQMVERSTAHAAKMAQRLETVHRW